MGYITKQGLEQLKKYQYHSGGMTWFDEKVNIFWEWIVTFMPTYIAPNLMTIMGWVFMCLSYGNMLRYDLTFDKDIPRWCFFFAAFCIFAFVTLDAIDGKQARRAKAGSPLGQLIDHGCDSFTMTSLMLGICQACQIDKNAVFVLFIATQLLFWTFNWTQNHTGVLSTRVGNIGVTQGQHLCMLIHILTGIFCQKMWVHTPSKFLPTTLVKTLSSTPILNKLINLSLGTTIAYMASILTICVTLYKFIDTLKKSKNAYQAGSQYFSSILIVIMLIVWRNTQFFNSYCGLILVNFGVVASLVLCKLIICTVTKVIYVLYLQMPVQRFHYQLIPSIIATIILIFLDLTNAEERKFKILFWNTFMINVIWVFSFLIATVRQITNFLGIRCFHVRKRLSLRGKGQVQLQEEKQRTSTGGENSKIKQEKKSA